MTKGGRGPQLAPKDEKDGAAGERGEAAGEAERGADFAEPEREEAEDEEVARVEEETDEEIEEEEATGEVRLGFFPFFFFEAGAGEREAAEVAKERVAGARGERGETDTFTFKTELPLTPLFV